MGESLEQAKSQALCSILLKVMSSGITMPRSHHSTCHPRLPTYNVTGLGGKNKNHVIDSSLVSKTMGVYDRVEVRGSKVLPKVLDRKCRFAIKAGH